MIHINMLALSFNDTIIIEKAWAFRLLHKSTDSNTVEMFHNFNNVLK